MTHHRSYAMAHLTDVEPGSAVQEYLERIDATLAPYDGRFLVHGGSAKVVEGEFRGDLIVIGFPAPDGAAGWYACQAYQQIVPLRAEHSQGWVVLIGAVTEPHRATDVLRTP